MEIDWEKIEEMTLALMHLTLRQAKRRVASEHGRDMTGMSSTDSTRGAGSRTLQPRRGRSS